MILERLKKHIKDKGIKQIKIAEQLDITPVYLSYILNGKKEPGIELEQRIKELAS